MEQPLTVLHLEDNPNDAELVQAALLREGIACDFVPARDRGEYLAALDRGAYDLIIADYNLFQFCGVEALQIARERRLDAPFILVSGTIGEETAVEALKMGATDYVMKGRLNRLGSSVRRAMADVETRAARARAEATLHMLRNAVEQAMDGIAVADTSGRILFANAAWAAMHGYSRAEDFIGLNLAVFHTAQQLRDDVIPFNEKAIRHGFHEGEVGHARRDGGTFPSYMTTTMLKRADGSPMGIIGIARDITERKRLEAQYRTLIETSPDAIVLEDTAGKVLIANRRAVEMVGGKRPEDVIGHNYAEFIHPQDRERGGAAFAALERGDAVRDFEFTVRRLDGREVPAELSAAPVDGHGGRMQAVVAVIKDITARKAAEAEIRRNASRLQKSLTDTSSALAVTVEKRDPYTAGHQRKVTNLAATIGRQMGLNEQGLAGLYIGGILHDVGKIGVPAEILSKPGALREFEFALVKHHVEMGYDILKDIDFPWPVAEMILQHHERMDGSGYPRGLKGEAILPEARILAVADVVEAMASHRPYRPALGVEVALAEIRKNSGRLYDPVVAEACVKVFAEGRFTFA
jgi:PAS domain S-box-containing protein